MILKEKLNQKLMNGPELNIVIDELYSAAKRGVNVIYTSRRLDNEDPRYLQEQGIFIEDLSGQYRLSFF